MFVHVSYNCVDVSRELLHLSQILVIGRSVPRADPITKAHISTIIITDHLQDGIMIILIIIIVTIIITIIVSHNSSKRVKAHQWS